RQSVSPATPGTQYNIDWRHGSAFAIARSGLWSSRDGHGLTSRLRFRQRGRGSASRRRPTRNSPRRAPRPNRIANMMEQQTSQTLHAHALHLSVGRRPLNARPARTVERFLQSSYTTSVPTPPSVKIFNNPECGILSSNKFNFFNPASIPTHPPSNFGNNSLTNHAAFPQF